MRDTLQPIKCVLPIKNHTRQPHCLLWLHGLHEELVPRRSRPGSNLLPSGCETIYEAIPESGSNLFGSRQSTALELILVCEGLRHLPQEALACPHRLQMTSNLLMCLSKSGVIDEPLRQKDRSWCR